MAGPNKTDIKAFLQTRKTLILDKSGVIRSTITQVLSSLGQPKNQIAEFTRINDAINYVREQKPQIIFTEYMIDRTLGFVLFQKTTEHYINERDRVYFLITGNTEDYAVAQAAEEEVDAYVIKPFSKDIINRYIEKTISEKIHLNDYLHEIIEAKNEINNKNYEAALSRLYTAVQLSETPALAYYYRGVCFQNQNKNNEALVEFNVGLDIHPKHFKCLLGKFETLEILKRYEEAYDVVQYLSDKYPINPDRLGTIIMLAVFTKNFSDIDKYYDFYIHLENKSERISKIVAAAMYAYSQVLLNSKQFNEAIVTLRKTIMASFRSKDYLEKAIEQLLKFNEPKAALEFLQMYSFDDQLQPDWKRLHFKTLSMIETPDWIIAKGKELITEGMLEIEIVKKVAQLLIDTDRKTQAENFIYSLIPQMPDQRTELNSLLEKLT